MKTTAFIFAAGLGTRLYPLTATKPKALVCYQGKTMLEHAIDKIVAAGIRHIIVNVHHFPDQIIRFLATHKKDARIEVSDERAYLRDTAGGLKFAEPKLRDSDLLLLYNVDILSSIDLGAFVRQHVGSAADVTLAVRRRETSRYLVFEKETLDLCGWKNIKSGETILPKPPRQSLELAFSGIHLMNRHVVNRIPSVEKMSLIPFYLHNIQQIKVKGFLHTDGLWMDVGKYADYKDVLF